ncbi:thiamine pyrophosphate-dependent enzyme [Xanthobacter tagetidis]|nr:thiamine pyrophosphate-dependent enzyme [Xanthobacter tagetidis]MBB6306479.1 hypothetical protein [Xanthobacter tagetidis]
MIRHAIVAAGDGALRRNWTLMPIKRAIAHQPSLARFIVRETRPGPGSPIPMRCSIFSPAPAAPPRRWLAAGSLGGIGVGISTPLGVKLARPEDPVLALVGDGAWSMTMQEVMTAVRERINLVTVIFSNRQ